MSRPFSERLGDGSRWPVDAEAIEEVAHRLRYRESDYDAASVVDAYLYLLGSSTRTQREKLRLIRAAQATKAAPGTVKP